MGLFSKIFFSVITVFGLIFLVSGYFLLSYSFDSNMERELEFALRQYKYDKFTLQSGILAHEDRILKEIDSGGDLREIFRSLTENINASVCLLWEDGREIYNETGEQYMESGRVLQDDSYYYQVIKGEEKSCILIASKIKQGDLSLGFATKTDITESISQQKVLAEFYEKCYFAVLIVGSILIFFLSMFLTRPLKKMAGAADQIANGHYSMRLDITGKDELGELAQSFNRMAKAVEQSVEELSKEARKKEDFVANFAHELKTPLTSVIGYADRIYQKDMPEEEVKKAAFYIWNEGMRLEALSLKLMDLTNLNKQDFSLEFLPAHELLSSISGEMEDFAGEKGVRLICQAEPAYIKTDYDLMKTLILNLIDNAIKAESRHISINGIRWEETYHIEIEDDGKGIPENELSRITEAFYMVDKARSRKQHGAGIGLSLVRRIVEIQDGELFIESNEGEGTAVTVCLPCEEMPDGTDIYSYGQ